MNAAVVGVLRPPAGSRPMPALLEAGPAWTLPPVDAAPCTWIGPAAPPGMAGVLGHAVRRESALVRLRYLGGRRRLARRTHRLPAKGSRLRAALAAEVVVELGDLGAAPRVLDEIVAAAALPAAPRRLRAAAGDSLVAAGEGILLRVAAPGGPDPGDATAALASLEGLALPAPRVVARGEVDGFRWTTETLLPGRTPRRLSAGLVAEVAAVVAALPRGPRPTAVVADLAAVAAALPSRADAVGAARRRADALLPTAPGIFRHGDLWRGNLLARRGRLTGIVDWDAAGPGGAVGADLLQLLVTDERHRQRLPLGTAWCERPWQQESWHLATAPYWRAIDVRPDEDVLELAALAWWAAEVAGTLRRHPHRAADERWLADNVDAVLDALG